MEIVRWFLFHPVAFSYATQVKFDQAVGLRIAIEQLSSPMLIFSFIEYEDQEQLN